MTCDLSRSALGGFRFSKECLAFHVLVAGHQAVERTGANYSRWQQSDDKGIRTSFWPGKFVTSCNFDSVAVNMLSLSKIKTFPIRKKNARSWDSSFLSLVWTVFSRGYLFFSSSLEVEVW